MKTLVLGASGATGRLVTSTLARRRVQVRTLIRDSAPLPPEWLFDPAVEIAKGEVDGMTAGQFAALLDGCDSVVCCLGHNVTFKGLFGQPRRLVLHAVRKVAEAIRLRGKTAKLVLMSTTAYTNAHAGEKHTLTEKVVFGTLKALLPPHADNVAAGDFLRNQVGAAPWIEWVAVRPDALIDEVTPSEVVIVDKKLRSPISNPGKTSRINVARFMADLLVDAALWDRWKYQTPVIYNKAWGNPGRAEEGRR